ncbi:hypothetical protein G6F62_014039 [Rhizopus arrhizus]|nr:hypothetical protein G6F40_014994 [Rhizopus arrhizus]KAG1313770.1 hypothetical protein G6F62_014039 [Rhizopus arrhizus]
MGALARRPLGAGRAGRAGADAGTDHRRRQCSRMVAGVPGGGAAAGGDLAADDGRLRHEPTARAAAPAAR